MPNKNIWLLVLISLTACATKDVSNGALQSREYTFPISENKNFSFKKNNCKIENAFISSSGGYASSGSYGTLAITNSVSRVTLEKYHVSCSAVTAVGKSKCVVQHIEGISSNNVYGGLTCPDMKFSLIDFKLF